MNRPAPGPDTQERPDIVDTLSLDRVRGSVPILLVEHFLPLAKPLLRGLEEEGIVAHLARDDAEARLRVQETLYAALVVDWNVPRQGGAALVRDWRQNGLTTPVLLLMPTASETDVREAVAVGADDLLPLPFAFSRLLERLQAQINGSASTILSGTQGSGSG
jgi:two-component system, OmpR family, response regulator